MENRARRPCSTLIGKGWRTGRGDHRPTKICLANHSRTGSPCPVLQQEVRVFYSPLQRGGGSCALALRGGGAVYLIVGGRGAEALVLLEEYSF